MKCSNCSGGVYLKYDNGVIDVEIKQWGVVIKYKNGERRRIPF